MLSRTLALLLLPFGALALACSGPSESGTSANELSGDGEPPAPTTLPGTPPVASSPAPSAAPLACYVRDAEWSAVVQVDRPLPQAACTSGEIDRVAETIAVTPDGDVEIAPPSDVSDPCAACVNDVALQDEGPEGTLSIAAYACVAALTFDDCGQWASDQRNCFLAHCGTCAADAYESCVDRTISDGKCSRLPPECKTAIETSGALACLHPAEVPGDALAATRTQLAFVTRTLCGR